MAKSDPIRLTVVMTHPVQYLAPWFRHIAANCPDIDLTVLYATQPTPRQQGVGFGRSFSWDQPLLQGYCCQVVRPPRRGNSVHSDRFWGLDVPEIVPALRATRPGVVLIGGWYSVTLLRALRACGRWHLPVLYRGDTHLDNAPPGWRRPLWRLKNRLLLRAFDGAMSVGQRTHAFLRELGMPEECIFSAPHCVDNDWFAKTTAPLQTAEGRTAARSAFGLPPDDFVVLFAGKLEPKKRPQQVIEATARLGPCTSLLLVGSGPLETECRELAHKHGVRAVWAGFLNQSEMSRAYAVADCLVLPSDWGETWGLVVNEALATGLPCVVSDRVGCAPDLVVPGKTGEVVPFSDVQSLEEALQRVRRAAVARGPGPPPAGRRWRVARSPRRPVDCWMRVEP